MKALYRRIRKKATGGTPRALAGLLHPALLEVRLDGLKRIGFQRRFVRPIPFDTGESQGHAGWITRRFLHAAKGDFPHEFRPDITGAVIPKGLEV
jgi:hypothetical protein